MSGRERLAGFVGGLIAGAAGGLFGVGGGVLLVPVLTGRFRLTQHQAHGTSLAVIGVTALAGIAVYGGAANVEWRTALIVGLGSIVTARWGARWANRLSSMRLRQVFAVFLVAVALRLLLFETPTRFDAGFHHGWQGVAFELALGAAVGLLAGSMGVGGGILAVPAFTLFLGMSQQAAQGTSLAVILFTGPAGAFEHARHGNVLWRLVPVLAVGAVIAAPLASWLAQDLPHPTLVRTFALFLLANGAVTWFKAGRRPATAP
jgi:uncharacterized membrane protein YfcA